MVEAWNNGIKEFIKLCNANGVKMLMVGGGAVNFHGYKRHSADVDFWIEPTAENFSKLLAVFQGMGYEITELPSAVKEMKQNISLKFSPAILHLELITNFSVNSTFQKAYDESVATSLSNDPSISWRVLSYDDLITSKIKSGRPKDLLDVQELHRIKDSGNI